MSTASSTRSRGRAGSRRGRRRSPSTARSPSCAGAAKHLSIEEAGETADWSTSESDAPAEVDQVALLRRGIAEALTDKQREAIDAVLGGLPTTELARRWGVSQGAIYKLLHDARRRPGGYMEEMSDACASQGWAS